MKFKVEIDENCIEPEITVKCHELTPEVIALQKALGSLGTGTQTLALTKNDTEFFLQADDIIFFETDERTVNAHTADNVYQTKYKLYELEKMFPMKFMRVSKSAIVNIGKIYSITKGLSNCFIQFAGSVKQLYVSRMYYKPLRDRMDERR
ncbi:MAG: LytTR family transcriptional regulator [Lachnospiraceae bacterium]|nr:LytTR family transcriptional regulator [Lachnospiraceae bacterium]